MNCYAFQLEIVCFQLGFFLFSVEAFYLFDEHVNAY